MIERNQERQQKENKKGKKEDAGAVVTFSYTAQGIKKVVIYLRFECEAENCFLTNG